MSMINRKIWISVFALILIISFFTPIVSVWESDGDIVTYSFFTVCIRDEVLPLPFIPIFISIGLYLYYINKERISIIILSLLVLASFFPFLFSVMIFVKALNGDVIYDGIAHFNNGVFIYFTIPILSFIVFLTSNRNTNN